jgi:hypothetical protein
MKTATMTIPLRLHAYAVKGIEWISLQNPSAHDCLRWASQGYEIKRVDSLTAMVLMSGSMVTTSDAAVVAKAIQDMSLEEKIAFGRHMLEGVESYLDEAIEGGPFFGEDDQPGVHIGPLDGEKPEQHTDRVYQELRDQHACSDGPDQRMRDAVALYNRTVKVEG